MTIRVFLPHEGLTRIVQQAILALAIIGAIAAVLVAGTLALYALTWFCSVLTTFVHTFSELCRALYVATGSTWVTEVVSFVLLLMLNIKIAFVLFPSLPAFFRKEVARV